MEIEIIVFHHGLNPLLVEKAMDRMEGLPRGRGNKHIKYERPPTSWAIGTANSHMPFTLAAARASVENVAVAVPAIPNDSYDGCRANSPSLTT